MVITEKMSFTERFTYSHFDFVGLPPVSLTTIEGEDRTEVRLISAFPPYIPPRWQHCAPIPTNLLSRPGLRRLKDGTSITKRKLVNPISVVYSIANRGAPAISGSHKQTEYRDFHNPASCNNARRHSQ